MTHEDKTPRFYPVRKELGWLVHNCVAHPVTGVVSFTGYLVSLVGMKRLGQGLLDVSEAIHEKVQPERDS